MRNARKPTASASIEAPATLAIAVQSLYKGRQRQALTSNRAGVNETGTYMKTLTTILAAALFAAGSAHATDTPVEVASLQVKERLAAIEQINVTAKKEIDAKAEAADAEVAAILELAETVEEE